MVLTRLESPPVIALLAAIGLFLCSLANALSRATLAPSPLIYWIGLLVIALPIFFRLSSAEPSYRERLGLILLLGLALYCVKVVHDGIFFTFSDEYVHAFNVHNIEKYNHLYHFNPGIQTTPYYPGLEGATSALTMLSGTSIYVSGTILVGAARLTFMRRSSSSSPASAAPPAAPASGSRSTPARATSSSGAPSSPTSRSRCRCWSWS